MGKEFCEADDGAPFSFVPVTTVSCDKEKCVTDDLMRPRPLLDLKKLFGSIGEAGPAPNPQSPSKPFVIAGNKASAFLKELQLPVKEQGFQIGVTIPPPVFSKECEEILRPSKKRKRR